LDETWVRSILDNEVGGGGGVKGRA